MTRTVNGTGHRAPGDRREGGHEEAGPARQSAGQSCSSDSASRNARSTRRRSAFEMARPGASTRAGSFGLRVVWRFLWLTENVIRVGTQVDPRHARRRKASLAPPRGRAPCRIYLSTPMVIPGATRAPPRTNEPDPMRGEANATRSSTCEARIKTRPPTSKAPRARCGPPQAHNSRPIPPRVALHKEP